MIDINREYRIIIADTIYELESKVNAMCMAGIDEEWQYTDWKVVGAPFVFNGKVCQNVVRVP